MAADGFPWREAMALGFGRLRLPSKDFWALTPRELAAAAEGLFGVPGTPIDRTTLSQLIERFPDRTGDTDAHTG
jgi:uncharacterized phage protein (TIGR02216 family)